MMAESRPRITGCQPNRNPDFSTIVALETNDENSRRRPQYHFTQRATPAILNSESPEPSRRNLVGTKIQVIFYSTYGHVYQLAKAIVEGAKDVPDTQVELFQVAETLSEEILQKM